ncbi:hypothetical protein PV04_01868 [Phialophora macrospora]|uniref:Required for respiratory growth protein 7, mitochondrial n=1 Tax=Phialophora macrospora TaxID=1851006 RepID=A0A0D2G4P1_9EURO|nr:hypothetical protein PV04_01868 [Phialophora macrospora]
MLLGRRLWRSGRHGTSCLPSTIQDVTASASAPVKATLASTLRLDPRVAARWFSPSSVTRSVDADDARRGRSLRLGQSSSPSETNITTAEEESPTPRLRPRLDAARASTSTHSSLRSFRAHAVRTGLSPTSTVYAGTTYEYVAQATLQAYGFDLYRVGGRGDRGVDLVGVWRVPVLSSAGQWKEKKNDHEKNRVSTQQQDAGSSPIDLHRYETQALKVLVQCKRLVGKHAKIGPHLIRELDGAVRGSRSTPLFDVVNAATARGQQDEIPDVAVDMEVDTDMNKETSHQSPLAGPALGVLVSTKPATKGVLDSMRRSTRGLIWIMMEEVTSQSPEIETDVGEVTSQTPEIGTDMQDEDQDGTPSLPRQQHGDSSSLEAYSAPDLTGRVKQILWNQAARDLGLEGVDVVKRYDDKGHEEVVLMRGGRVWGST